MVMKNMTAESGWFGPLVIAALSAPVWTGQVHADTTFTVSAERTIQIPADGPRTHAAVITAISIQPRGKLVAAAGDDHVIRLWSLQDGSLELRLVGHRDWIRAVGFSPDGKTLVSSGNDRHVYLWDVATGQRLKTLAVHDHAVDVVTFSHSGRWVATAGFENRLCIIDTTGQAERREFECVCSDIRAIAISDDDRYVAAGGRDGVIRVWDLQTDQLIRQAQAHEQRIRSITFSQEAAQLISGGEDRLVRIWNWNTDDQVFKLPRLRAKVMSLVTCGPQILATAGSDNTIRLWNLATREQLGQLTGHTGSVAALAYQDGVLVSGGFDTQLRIWNVPTQVEVGVRSAQRRAVVGGQVGSRNGLSCSASRRLIVGLFSKLLSRQARRRSAAAIAHLKRGQCAAAMHALKQWNRDGCCRPTRSCWEPSTSKKISGPTCTAIGSN